MTTNTNEKKNEIKLELNDELLDKFDKLPEIVEPKHLAEMYNIDSKLVRNTLRQLFPQHEKNTPWQFKKSGNSIKHVANKLVNTKSKTGIIYD